MNISERSTMTNVGTTLETQQEILSIQQSSNNYAFIAEVKDVISDKEVSLDVEGNIVNAKVMLSCLVSIIKYDKVLVIQDERGDYYISGLVSRLSEEPISISSEGRDLVINAKNFSINTKTFATQANSIYQSADELQQYFRNLTVASENYEHLGKKSNVNFSEMSVTVNALTEKIKFLFEKIGVASRNIEQLEKVDSNMRQDNVRTQLLINAGNAQITSKSSVQINARQIFMS